MSIPKGAMWPVMVVGLLGLNVAVVSVTLVLATRDPSFAVEPDYYDKAVAWDETARRREASRALGWIAAVEAPAEEVAPGRREIVLTLRDAAGAPVAGAQAGAVVFHNARAADREAVTLIETEPGVYRGRTRLRMAGRWIVALEVVRGGEVFVEELSVEAGATEGGGG